MWVRKWIEKREEGAYGELLKELKSEDEIFDENFVFIRTSLVSCTALTFCSCQY
jgi:hypothetical protein